jgi:aryl-alcohol dehydrogenase-like predicted oxidoreductase
MEYVKLGASGIEVSRICAGCMGFGEPGRDMLHKWTLPYEDTERIIAHALGLGINFFDTANAYGEGTSEEYLGRALKKHAARDKVAIATKVFWNEGKLSRAAILREIDGSLARLGTDYVDLYIIHRFDYGTPIEETMEALNDVVKAGKARAIGASAMYGYQFHNMQLAAERNGWARFVSMQNHYNLLYREDERDLIPICRQMGVALTPYSPLAAGKLSRAEWDADTRRSRSDTSSYERYGGAESADHRIALRVGEVAAKHGATMTQVALAWHFAKGVTAPILGTTNAAHFDDAAGALSVALTPEDVAYLEEPYEPHKVSGPI